ncbi:MAG: BREX-1 system adenine-specific DNA-methyltransferase PglX [Mobilitalea sp.]
MDKRILQTYSAWAKENLEKQVEVSLKTLGINGDKDIKKAKQVGEYTVIEGDSNSYPADLLNKRSQIVTLVTDEGYKNVIEEFAYTWFNRFVALRFMEVHDFLPHGFRVLSNRSGGVEPEIFKNLSFVKEELRLDMITCDSLKEQGKIEELYRYVLLHQCSALADILPMLFARENDYLELLLPKSLLIGETVITKLIEIPEENFLNDVEIIGWMYQFYISVKKDEVFASKTTITKDTLPAVTQLFTPDWIVRYMAENSVGRVWMESYPHSSLRSEMKYYVDDPEQTEEVQRKLDAMKYRNVNPEEIRVIEPCCGSGHILVYVFDLLYKMYDEKGYSNRVIPSLILKNNLTGLDVDKRASQLAAFSLVMKARSINPRFFNDTYYCAPQVYEIYDSHYLESIGYRQHMKNIGVFTEYERKAIETLVETFRNGKTIGSLIKVKTIKYECVEKVIYKLEHEVVANIFDIPFVVDGTALLKKLLAQAKVLSTKYDVMITNPPYIGISTMEAPVKDYAVKNYPNSKSDMFAMFMETEFVNPNGFIAIINMHSWMFLSSFEKLRQTLLVTKEIVTMAHLGARAFETIGGEVVQTTTFVLRNCRLNINGVYYRLVNSTDKENDFLLDSNGVEVLKKQTRYVTNEDNFTKIPGSIFCYWLSDAVLQHLEKDDKLEAKGTAKQGLSTSDNNRFLRFWHEVVLMRIGFSCEECKDTSTEEYRWFPYNKAGNYRKWSSINEYVVNYQYDGLEIKQTVMQKYPYLNGPGFVVKNTESYFHHGITWNDVATGPFCCRYVPNGFIYADAGPMYFSGDDFFAMAYFNSNTFQVFADIICQGLHYSTGHIPQIPYKEPMPEEKEKIRNLSKENYIKSKEEWDSFESSWDFQTHPLTGENSIGQLISDKYRKWENECQQRFVTLKANEEELNRIFIDIYGLQDELTPEVENKDVTVRLADKERDIRSLISYLVGVVLGRYSIDVDGLAYAGENWDVSKYHTYQPDDDGIVPIYSGIGMEDGLTACIIELLKQIYGTDTYRQNIDFIAEALGKNNNESSEESLNRYLNEGFYVDHLKIYHKRPIYWMFSSGKYSGFKCLIYMHRYNEDTLAQINGRYFLPESTRLKNDLDELLARIESSEGRDRIHLEKERQKLAASYIEAIEYGQVLDHMANKYIAIDLDDGVKANYDKFQGVELITDNSMKVKKDLLVPIK